MNYKFKTKPYAHQLKALEMSWKKEVFALFMEMGTGKSKVLLDNISMLYDKGKINGALIVAPKGVYKNWLESEIPQHLVKHIQKNDCLSCQLFFPIRSKAVLSSKLYKKSVGHD